MVKNIKRFKLSCQLLNVLHTFRKLGNIKNKPNFPLFFIEEQKRLI